jgi:hypothetical protein
VSYHKRRLGHTNRRALQQALRLDGRPALLRRRPTITQCQEEFGFARKTFMDAVARGVLVSRPQGAPVAEYLVRDRRVNRTHLKARLMAAGLKQNRCERCGIEEWLGEPLAMALHHVNGTGTDNRLENLMMLCPNCHAQTPNFSGRNRPLRLVS